MPAAIIQAQKNWAALRERESTWTEVEAEWATWADLRDDAWPIRSEGASTTALALTASAHLFLTADGTSSSALALTAPTGLALAASPGTATAGLALSAPPLLSLQSTGESSTAAALRAPTQVPTAPAAGVASTALVLTIRTLIENRSWAALTRREPTWADVKAEWASWAALQAPPWPLYADGRASTALALTAPTQVLLDPATGVSTSALALTAPARLMLDPATGVSTSVATVQTGAPITGTADGVATTGALALSVRTFIEAKTWQALRRREPTWESTEAEWATWADLLKASWPLYADGVATTRLALAAPALLQLATAGGSSTALALGAPALLTLASTGTSTTLLLLYWPRFKVRQASAWVPADHTPGLRVKRSDGWVAV